VLCTLTNAIILEYWNGDNVPETYFDVCFSKAWIKGDLVNPNLSVDSTPGAIWMGITRKVWLWLLTFKVKSFKIIVLAIRQQPLQFPFMIGILYSSITNIKIICKIVSTSKCRLLTKLRLILGFNFMQNSNPLNGYFCSESNEQCYANEISSGQAFWIVNLGKSYQISKLSIRSFRDSYKIVGSRIRIGSNPSWENNPIVHEIQQYEGDYEMYDIVLKYPAEGQFVSVDNYQLLTICRISAYEWLADGWISYRVNNQLSYWNITYLK